MNFYDEENAILGYKAFNSGLVNKYGMKFEEGNTYIDGNVDKEYGYHFCKNLEDVFIFFRDTDNVDVCMVLGYGKTINYYNDYYGVYDIFATDTLKIIKKLDRIDIINYFLSLSSLYRDKILRFISLFKLTEEECRLFKDKFRDDYLILDYISYYQEGILDVFKNRTMNRILKYKRK